MNDTAKVRTQYDLALELRITMYSSFIPFLKEMLIDFLLRVRYFVDCENLMVKETHAVGIDRIYRVVGETAIIFF